MSQAEQIFNRDKVITSTQLIHPIDKDNLLTLSSLHNSRFYESGMNEVDSPFDNYVSNFLHKQAHVNHIAMFALASCLNFTSPMTCTSSGMNTPVIENISDQALNLTNFSLHTELLKKNTSRKANKEKLKALSNLLSENLRSKNKAHILDDVELSAKIEAALSEISKLNYDKAAIELTVFKILNVSLKIDAKDLFVKIGIPLTDNVQDLPSGEVLYTYARNNQIVDSDNTTLKELAEEIDQLS